ncbi:hypothetical protein BB559_006920 [Furculomyces boomerangus]|uniref:RNA helicase n=1 Tax=Furculomyces boomerangus TaxID=61424 RepID=A0A2T9XZV5_9FUNG|nr:hypothetical protein BB559_006920 [Furculomyces boomerangus]
MIKNHKHSKSKEESGSIPSNGKEKQENLTQKDKYKLRAKNLLKQRKELPIYSAKDAIVKSIEKNKTVVVIGETGSGKTTQIPQFLLESGMVRNFGSAIAVTQPRRVAATSISKRVADEVGTKLGVKVGYGIRFDDCSSKYTKIKYLTDGMLLREVLSDPLLLKYKVVILDEAHERTLRTDILFGMLKDIQKKREELYHQQKAKRKSNKKKEFEYNQNLEEHSKKKPKVHTFFGENTELNNKESINVNGKHKTEDNDISKNGDISEKSKDLVETTEKDVEELKIIIMSATLDAEKFSKYFNDAPVLYISGRQFPVKIFYTNEPQSDYLDSAHITVMQIHLETNPNSGDILVFLSGQEEIESLEKLISESNNQIAPNSSSGTLIPAPIYAALPQHQQNKVFEKTPQNSRKVVLATNIAETSITIPGIRYVVDTGVHKVRGFDPRIGVESLLVNPISKSSSRQRSGRAGRMESGVCYRLYTEGDYDKLEEDDEPEIKRRQLTSVILTLKAAGIDDVLGFDYMDIPSKPAMKNALLELYSLEALDENGNLCELGRWMAEFPLDPIYSKVLYESQKYKCTSEALDLVAALSVETLFYNPINSRDQAAAAHKQFMSIDGDHWTVINLLRAYNEYRDNSTKVVIFDQVEEQDLVGTPENGNISKKSNENHRNEELDDQNSTKRHKKDNVTKNSQQKMEYWCHKHFVNYRNLTHVIKVRQQITKLCLRLGINPDVSCGDQTDDVLICLLSGFFYKCAMLQPDGTYRSLSGSQTVHIHPASSMFRKKAAAIVYDQLVFTNKLYAKGVSAIQPGWLSIAAPRLYGQKLI